ncbi:hypothetical protein JNUCC42_21295 [Brevibacterium sp. JNUCC-42]|nr:hypothetical protein JNUCC42_21295 [Brevibacterium sp. JNUCC-42]
MKKKWTKAEITAKLHLINQKGYISIPANKFRVDDGVVGQVLENEFGVTENNLSLGDLGEYELKGMRNRKAKSNLTLFHKKPKSGYTVVELFDRFGYIKRSNRDPNIIKKKLFTTIKGGRVNSLGLTLKANNASEINLYYQDEYLSTWDLDLTKIQKMVLAFANTLGTSNSSNEQFHFVEAYMLTETNDITALINDGILVMDLCVDQVYNSSRGPHDRGPHLRIPVSKLNKLYKNIERLL